MDRIGWQRSLGYWLVAGVASCVASCVGTGTLCSCGNRLLAEQPKPVIRESTLGEARVTVVVRDYGPSKFVFCNLHDDENTSVEAAESVLSDDHGRLIEIRHTGKRNCAFSLAGKKFALDPNRIFTAAGVEATLAAHSNESPDEEAAQHTPEQTLVNPRAIAAVKQFADELLGVMCLDEVDAVVALHNNTDARYSAASYLQGNVYAKDAEDVFIAKGSDADDFLFVTERPLFESFKSRGLNVVLQNNSTVTDDGSLSVYCGKKGKAYINVEAEHGHLAQQIDMLKTVIEVLQDRQE